MTLKAAWFFISLVTLSGITGLSFAPKQNRNQDIHVWEKIEIKLRAKKQYDNPYTGMILWVDLKGPGFKRRCYGFWDGDDRFIVRIMATSPGKWTWKSGSDPSDPGLEAVSGSFTARDWTEAEKVRNPNRRGMIKPSANGHSFVYADGTPYFLTGDTWWATPTFRFPWREDDSVRLVGPDSGFKDFVAFRRSQGFNCIAMIAAFPNWACDDQPSNLKMPEGTVLRSAWGQAGTRSAKTMTDEAGNRAFRFPGKVPGYEQYFPDVERINPDYFRSMDRKIDYLNEQGFIPFIEVARRDVGQAWKKYYPWPDSYTRYIQYIWCRYQANVCLYSPIHFDSPGGTVTADDWNSAANKVIDEYGPPPFATLAGTNPSGSSLQNWGGTAKAKWLGFHQIGNLRTHDSYSLLTEIFRSDPPLPAINGEPYYDGMENLEGGSEEAALYCRSAMYGSVLSGGLGGHIYGAGGWNGGIWSGEVEAASKTPMWKAFLWPSGAQMQHLQTFILSVGARYQNLIPCTDKIIPDKSGKTGGATGWAFGAGTSELDLFLIYFEKFCLPATLTTGKPSGRYSARWFNPRNSQWIAYPDTVTADPSGNIFIPSFPDNPAKSENDWAIKLELVN